ncbi:MAG: class I SAM-dependent methyltransferase [Ktedonobacteraceae bacterium]|nr:class I SAM-dependent methyltransferase [Ktedonobacteraceae bacterium]MBV9711245.1 class I SAM-dependent methyltransferase [Ktedonobacteraceae bacterium]
MTTDANGGYVLDVESPTEMARLINLDQFITKGMGGALTGLEEFSLEQILDVACGPGGWVLNAAFASPDVEVTGIDLSKTMIDYARARAQSQELPNAFFEIMNITRPLEFDDETFDLVNARFLVGVLKREQWAPLITECTRILRPGGILRLTETLNYGATTSRAYEQFFALCAQALFQAGYGFSVDGRTFDMTPVLPRLLRNAGYSTVHIKAHALEISAGTEGWSDFYRNADITSQTILPFLIKTNVATEEEGKALHDQLLVDLLSEDFCGMWHYVSAWGIKES